MPRIACDSPPLSRHDLTRFLQALFYDAATTPDLAIEAFSVTAASLYGWCDPADVDAALAMISMPVPRGTSKRQTAVAN